MLFVCLILAQDSLQRGGLRFSGTREKEIWYSQRPPMPLLDLFHICIQWQISRRFDQRDRYERGNGERF